MRKLLSAILSLVTILPLLLGLFANPTSINAAQGYGKEAQKALANNGGAMNPTKGSTSSSSSSMSSAPSSSSSSDDKKGVAATQVRQLTKPYVAIGTGANQDSINNLKTSLNVKNDTTTLNVNGADVNKYLNIPTTNAQSISSASVIPSPSGSGVNVQIAKFNGQNNITKVTQQQYAMVATMAGLKDVTITVTADQKVTGEAALAGIYKALAADGIPLSNENTQVANGMLDATGSANNANKNDKAYPSKLSGAVLDASGKVSQGTDPKKALMDALNDAGIAKETPQPDQDAMVSQLAKFQSTPVANDKDYANNIADTAKSLKNNDYANQVNKVVSDVTGNNLNIFQKVGHTWLNGWKLMGNWTKSAWAYVTTAGKGISTDIPEVTVKQKSHKNANSSSVNNDTKSSNSDQSISIVGDSSK